MRNVVEVRNIAADIGCRGWKKIFAIRLFSKVMLRIELLGIQPFHVGYMKVFKKHGL
jgi:hypothetical protein